MAFDLNEMVVSHIDAWWAQYRRRLDGLTDDEHLWSPTSECWTVREHDGRWLIDDVDRGVQPAPFTSIAWRMWHIAVDCLDSYSRRAFGRQAGPDDMVWVGTAAEALARTDASWTVFRDAVAGLDGDAMRARLGPGFGGFAERSYADLALHAHAEVTHHGAEVALLRDLYPITGGARL